MPIDLRCPACGATATVPDALAGKTVRCKSCEEAFPVRASPTAETKTAKPLPAKPARAVAVPDETPKPARRAAVARASDDDEDDAPRGRRGAAKPAKKSKLPLILAGVFGLLVLVGGAGAAVVLSGVLDSKPDKPDVVLIPKPGDGERIGGPGTDLKKPDATPLPDKVEPKVEPKGVQNTGAPVAPPVAPSERTKPGGVVVPIEPLKPVAPPAATTPARAKTDMDQVTINKVREATVYIEVEINEGTASGSGWFGLEQNLIFTNAHVIHMLTPGSPKPRKLTIWVNPGTAKERKIDHARLEILAVDQQMDLALIKVINEPDLPAPLPVRPSREIRDLEKLLVIGYPNGRTFQRVAKSTSAPAATLTSSEFSSIRYDDDGNSNLVQIKAAAAPGNSGGPCFDMDGNVVAVIVAVPGDIKFRYIASYCVPTEYVFGLMAGRVAEIEYGQAYKKDGRVRVPVKIECLDPFEKLKEVGFGCWVGDAAGKSRAPGDTRTGVDAGDDHFQEVKLTYKYEKDKQVATGELIYPPELPAGRAYWAQAYYTNRIVPKYWMGGRPLKLSGPPVDIEDADLVVRYKTGWYRPIQLLSSSNVEEYEPGQEHGEKLVLENDIKGTEKVEPPGDMASVARLRVQYEKLALKAELGDGKKDVLSMIMPKDLFVAVTQNIKLIQGLALVNKTGEITKTMSDLRGAPAFAPLFRKFSEDTMQALQQSSVPLPNGRVKPNTTWTAEKLGRFALTLAGEEASEEGGKGPKGKGPKGKGPKEANARKVIEYKYVEQVNYTYLGTRTRLGTKEAVLKIEGTIKPAEGSSTSSGAKGTVKGHAFIDTETGTILECELHREFEMDTSRDGVKQIVSGFGNYKVVRGSAQTGQ